MADFGIYQRLLSIDKESINITSPKDTLGMSVSLAKSHKPMIVPKLWAIISNRAALYLIFQ